MKKLLAATALVMAVSFSNPAMAVDTTQKTTKEEFKKMSPEEREAFHAKKKAEWDKLSKADKLKEIEKKRAERIKRMDDKWSKMSDDEKISFVEKRMEKKGRHHKKDRE